MDVLEFAYDSIDEFYLDQVINLYMTKYDVARYQFSLKIDVSWDTIQYNNKSQYIG